MIRDQPSRVGDLGALQPERLADAGNYLALAAVINGAQRQPDQAIKVLLGSCGDEEAFRWAWALSGEHQVWRHAASLPSEVAVPSDLWQAVTAFILDRSTPAQDSARETLLRKLPPQSELAVSIARALAEGVGAPVSLRNVALGILGASVADADRQILTKDAASLRPDDRVRRLLLLRPPYLNSEILLFVKAIEEVAARTYDNQAWASVAELAARLPVPDLASLLARSWPRQESKTQLIGGGLLAKLGLETVRELLAEKLGAEVTQLVLDQLPHQLPLDDSLVAFGVWAHPLFGTDALKPFRKAFAQQVSAAERHGGRREREPALEALRAFAFASDDNEPAAELAGFLGAADVVVPAGHVLDAQMAPRLGRVLGCLLVRDAVRFEDVVNAAVSNVDIELRQHVFAGLAATAAPSQPGLPLRTMQLLLADRRSINAVVARGHSSPLVAATEKHPAAACEVLLAAADLLKREDAERLLAEVSWVDPGVDIYTQVIDVFEEQPPVLFGELHRAIDSLGGPEAYRVPTAILVRLLDLCLRGGLSDAFGTDTMKMVAALLDHPQPAVIDRVCAWIRRTDIEGSDLNHERVRLVRNADDARGGAHEKLHELRDDLGAALAREAQDSEFDADWRCSALDLAAEVSPADARHAAFALAHAEVNQLREAAANTLLATPAEPEDHERLEKLLAGEPLASIRARLSAALHQVRSGSVGEALRNLAELLGKTTESLDPDVLLPDEVFHDRFRTWTDKARSRVGDSHDPGPFVEAALNLVETMVDAAVLQAHAAGQLQKRLPEAQAQGIRTNANPRPDVGELLQMQALQQQFPWFPACLVLRARRGAHAAPIGRTKPLDLVPEDLVTAKTLLGDIFQGWVDSMWQIHNASGRL